MCNRKKMTGRNVNPGLTEPNFFIWLNEEMKKRGKDVYAVGLSANATLNRGTEYSERLDTVIGGIPPYFYAGCVFD